VLFDSDWAMRFVMEKNPDIRFVSQVV